MLKNDIILSVRPFKTLVIAYACNPYRGSEHGVGWGWVKMIAESHEVHVITAVFEKNDIKHWLDHHPAYKARIHLYYPGHRAFHYQKQSKVWLKIEHSPFKIFMNMAYRLWQKEAFTLAKRLHREHDFDLCHLVTYVGFRFPGRFYQLECPFVWGPVGGLENTPWHLIRLLGPYGAVYYSARNLINEFDRRFLPGPKRAMKKAARNNGIIAATSGMQKEIRKWYKAESTVICEIGPPAIDAPNAVLSRSKGEPLRICWSGEHLPGKAFPLLVRALAKMPARVKWRVDVLGAGPLTKKWKNQARAAGIAPKCTFHGNLPRQEALGVMRQAHLVVITSLKDLTSTVLLEALSQGVPVIALDHCGFSDVLTPECGIKIPVQNPRQVVRDIAEAIIRLWSNETHRRHLAKGALRRVQDFSWEKKAEKINTIYERVVSGQC